jgi:photosystem II stability/assembly factor-like uncharacterized protein
LLLCWFAVANLRQASAQSRPYTIQTSSKETEDEARVEASKLAAAGFAAHWLKAEVSGKGTRYRVRFGRFATQAEAKARADEAVKKGLMAEYIITIYETPTALVAAHKPTPALAPEKSESESKPLTAKTEPKAEPKVEKAEPSTPPAPREVKPSKVAVIPIKPAASETPAPPVNNKEPETPRSAENKPTEAANTTPDKVTPPPVIAGPPMAEALGEVDFTNRNWKVVRKSTATDKNLRAVYFVDSMTGWTAGDAGALHRTTDGGKTWKPMLAGVPATITQIQFIDWNTGWLLGEQTRKDDELVETVVLSTTNGGRSWTKKALPNIQSIWFTDTQKGWAVGKNATILQTFDGGNEWKPYADAEKLIGLPVESSNYNFGFREVFFLDAQNGWLIGNFYGRAVTNIGGLFATNDGGATWKRIPFTVQTQYSSGRFTPGTLQAVRFTDVNTGSLTGEMNDGEGRFFFVLNTRDGGKSWDQFRTPSRAAHSSQFLGTGTGWTAAAAMREGGADAKVYDTTLMRTDNGGASWRHDFVARGNRILGVFFLSSQRGWAVGDRGMILRYEEKTRTN